MPYISIYKDKGDMKLAKLSLVYLENYFSKVSDVCLIDDEQKEYLLLIIRGSLVIAEINNAGIELLGAIDDFTKGITFCHLKARLKKGVSSNPKECWFLWIKRGL